MDLIVDANIIFAALIKEGITIEIILEPEIHLFAPEFIFEEILKYKEEIMKKTHRKEDELIALFELLKEKITFMPMKELDPFMVKAESISPDEDDIPYIALALKLNIPIWSNDRNLKEKQNHVKVYSTKDLLEGKI